MKILNTSKQLTLAQLSWSGEYPKGMVMIFDSWCRVKDTKECDKCIHRNGYILREKCDEIYTPLVV